MPRVKPLATNPEELKIRQEVGAIMGALNFTVKDLSEATGIGYSTLKNRLSKNGISGMRLSELWAIRELGRRKGVL